MIHGTGYTLVNMENFGIDTDEYHVYVYKEKLYYYEAMSDCYEPSCRSTGKYEIDVRKWRRHNGYRSCDNCSGEGISTGLVDRDTANRIYWCLKHRNIPYDEVKRYFSEIREKN